MSEKIRYKKPPITQRIIGVYHQISEDDFQKKLPSWIEKIRDAYPIQEPLAEWTLDIEQKGGIPLLKNLTPKASIIHLFWKQNMKGRHVHGMRIRPDRLVFHLNSQKDEPHDFDELLPEMEYWLPKWAEHFGVGKLSGVSAEYLNELSREVTPQFIDDKGALNLPRILTVFGTFSKRSASLIHPLQCQVRMVMDEKKPTFLDLRVYDDQKNAPCVKVDFIVTTYMAGGISLDQAVPELRIGHDLILEEFDCVFSEDAKQSFFRL